MVQTGTFADTPRITAVSRRHNMEFRIWIESNKRVQGQPTDGQWWVVRPPTSAAVLKCNKKAKKEGKEI